jgi:hypothetical protein
MFEFPAVDDQRQFADVYLVEDDAARRVEERRVDRDGLRTVRVTLGEPLVLPLRETVSKGLLKLSPEAAIAAQGYDFVLLRLVVNVHPSANFGAALIDVKLELEHEATDPPALPVVSLQDTAAPPIAYDLSPRSVTDEVEAEASRSLSPTLKFDKVEASLGSVGLTLKDKRLEPVITAYGVREREAGWRFDRGVRGRYVAAGAKELDAVIRRRRGAPGRCHVSVSGQGTGGFLRPRPDVTPQRHAFRF